MPCHKKLHLNTWLIGLTPPPGAFAHIPNNGNPLFVTDVRIQARQELRQESMEKIILPENISLEISSDGLDEKTKTMWAIITSVAPEFTPIGETDEEKQKQEKEFKRLKGQEIWIRIY